MYYIPVGQKLDIDWRYCTTASHVIADWYRMAKFCNKTHNSPIQTVPGHPQAGHWSHRYRAHWRPVGDRTGHDVWLLVFNRWNGRNLLWGKGTFAMACVHGGKGTFAMPCVHLAVPAFGCHLITSGQSTTQQCKPCPSVVNPVLNSLIGSEAGIMSTCTFVLVFFYSVNLPLGDRLYGAFH